MMQAALRRHLIEPFYETAKGGARLKYWKELEQSQYLPAEVLSDRQLARLKALLSFVYENNAFYRRRFDEAGLRPDDVRSVRDIGILPVLTKEEIRENMATIISRGFATEGLLRFKTGGSMGKALALYITEDCSERRNACARRHDRWSGWEVGEPIGALWGNVADPTMKQRLRGMLLSPYIWLDTMEVTERSVRAFENDWKKARPTLLFGHAHSLFLLAQYVQRLGITGIAPKAIISTSMMLLPSERALIEGVFGLRVFDRYGCEEVSLIASECEAHEGMHLNIEHLYIEFVKEDGTHAGAGEPGRIIVTDLMNYAMPFIRYNVEDVGVPKAGMCSCGRGMPLMEHVTGRVADFLVKPDGSRVAGVSLIENSLTKFPGIDQMQIVQEAVDAIILRLVTGPAFTHREAGALTDYFHQVFGQKACVRLELTGEIKPESSGKYRFSICRVP